MASATMATRDATAAYLRTRAPAELHPAQRNVLETLVAAEEVAAVFNAAGGAPPPTDAGLRGLLAAAAGVLYSPAFWDFFYPA